MSEQHLADPARALRQQLEALRRAGLTHLAAGHASDKTLTVAPPAPEPETTPAPLPPVQELVEELRRPPETPPPRPARDLPVNVSTMPRAQREQQLTDLSQQVAACQKCQELATTRTQTVFGVGNPEANILFIGEAPGADEDRQGEPFVGRAGKLLNDIITACGLQREEIYICNILRCRPPGNRNPSPTEAANCREFLDGQIATVDPDYIVCWGTIAAQNLLDETTTIGKLRKKFFQYGRAKVLCTYHPSYLLRNPSAKRDVWDDMKFLFRDMDIELKP